MFDRLAGRSIVSEPESVLQLPASSAAAWRPGGDYGGEAAAGVSLRKHADIGRASALPWWEKWQRVRWRTVRSNRNATLSSVCGKTHADGR